MNCRYCGTELPADALFCPECGRAVTVDAAPQPVTASAGFSIADLAPDSPVDAPIDAPAVAPAAAGDHEHAATARCPQCGADVGADDVFCGECGFVLRAVAPPAGDVERQPEPEGSAGAPTSIIVLPDLISLGGFPADPEAPKPDQTTEVEPVVYGALDALPVPAVGDGGSDESAPHDAGADDADEPDEVDPDDDGASVDELIHETPAHVAAVAAAIPEPDPDLEFDEPLPFALPIAKKPTPSPRSRPIPDPFPWGTDRPLREDIEATRLIADTASGTRFVLQFSTGESVTVIGSGLVGRNPSMQPGEYVDQLVPIFDAGKSVSKTHLEYGQEGGRFWISDRYSTNGSTIRQPDVEPRRADPGRRYFVARGTRVDLGEQFFVVS